MSTFNGTFRQRKIERTMARLMLTGPHSGKDTEQVAISIWTKRGHEDRWLKGDWKKFRRLAGEAYEKRTPATPNPCLVPLDAEEEGGPYVYAHIEVKVPDVLRTEQSHGGGPA